MSIVWLRCAVALYSLGLLHALLALAHRRRPGLFRAALGAFYTAVVLHAVHLVEHAVAARHFPANDFFESVTLCGWIIAVLFLVAYWRYRFEALALFSFPLVFILTLVGELGSPIAQWNSAGLRDAWLMIHVVLVLVGYAALFLTAVASAMYLIRERDIKAKRAGGKSAVLPPLNTLDQLMGRALSVGFIAITLSVIAGSTWASVEFGTRWIRDPRIVISLMTWGLYLTVVFMRVSAGWRGRRAAVMLLVLVGCSALTWAAHTGLRTWLSR